MSFILRNMTTGEYKCDRETLNRKMAEIDQVIDNMAHPGFMQVVDDLKKAKESLLNLYFDDEV